MYDASVRCIEYFTLIFSRAATATNTTQIYIDTGTVVILIRTLWSAGPMPLAYEFQPLLYSISIYFSL
jgi:hypothetical protein